MDQIKGTDDTKQTNEDSVEIVDPLVREPVLENPTAHIVDTSLDESRGARPRTFTERARDYELDKAEKSFQKLRKNSDLIKEMINKNTPFDTIRAKHMLWMGRYEAFLEHHHSILPRLPKDDKDEYVNNFSEKDKQLNDFKDSLQQYFMKNSEEQQTLSQLDRKSVDRRSYVSSHHSSNKNSTLGSSKSSSIGHSSKSSVTGSHKTNISSKKLREEQKQAVLKAKIIALEMKKEIEMAKTKIRFEEEKLQLKTDIAISDAKTEVLNKYENQINLGSGSDDQSKTSQRRSTLSDGYKLTDIPNMHNREQLSHLNVYAKPYIPTRWTTHENQNDDDAYVRSAINPVNTANKSDNQQRNSDNRADILNPSYHTDNHGDMISVVKHLRKPVADIRKFGGDPLEFRKFIRQFNARIVVNAENEDEKMTYLEQYTYGEANKVVSGFGQLNSECAYHLAMKQLNERYGNEEVIANAFVKKALEWPAINPGDAKSLDDFSLFLIECKNAIESIEAIRILEYSENIKKLMQKLPLYLHDRWRNVVLKIRDKKESVRISDFVDFVQLEARKLNDPIYGKPAVSLGTHSSRTKMKLQNSQKLKNTQFNKDTFATDIKKETERHQNDQSCTYCSSVTHRVEDCKQILIIPIQKRQEHLRSKGHCYGCLKRGHRSSVCRNRLFCKICKRRHPTLLHDDARIAKSKQEITTQSENSEKSGDNGKSSVSTTHIVDSGNQSETGDVSCAMAIIPVKVKLNNKGPVIETYAFFDSGSSVSFCTETLLRRLGGSGRRMEIKLNTMGEPFSMTTFAVSGMQVMDLDVNNTVKLPTIYTKDEIPVTKDHIPKQDEISRWSHLSDIIIPVLDCEIGLMIGNNIADAYTPFEIATGPSGSPHATKTRLGWIVWNLVRNFNKGDVVANRAHLMTVQQAEDHSRLEELLKHSIMLDFPERIVDDKRENSLTDKKFLENVNQSIIFENEHYTIGLPFRDQNLKLPNNESQHLIRMKGLKTKFAKDEKFKRDYVEFMNKLLAKGYMEPVPKQQMDRHDGRVWYIPHHGVYHNKNPDKFRVVFDCSSMYMGISLNKQLMQGPDLTNNLLGVLLRFREEKVAILGDIEAMFHQVKVPPHDRDCLRFYWWPDGDFEKAPVQYRMTAHLFGATSSPSCCNFALKRTAEDFGEKYDTKVVETITKDMYVDDCLSSVKSKNEAISRIKDVTSLCKEGGFHMTKWISNLPEVIESVPEDERAKEVRHWGPEDGLPVERALGVKWFIETDEIGFNVKISEKPATRRSILSITSSVYDPLGIVSPFVLSAKSLLQILCKKKGLSWDTEITGVELKRWKEWLAQLDELKNIRLKRCYKPADFDDVVSCQLHCFSDASDIGYGMVFYVRFIDNKGNIHCSFVLGKSRVAPLKKITVPRMELTAASTAVKLSKVIAEQLNYDVNEMIFWTDSMSVIRYINNKDTRFHTFVANRLELIREATEPR